MPRARLLTEVWSYSPRVRSRAVDTTLHRLRHKLEPDPRSPRLLVTRHGEGIVLTGVREPTERPRPQGLVRRPRAVTLLGRTGSLAALEAALVRGRVITLTGPPGVGKTALAEAALARWDDGRRAAIFVRVVANEALDATVARILAPAAQGRSVAEALSTFEQPLLVVDDAQDLDEEAVLALARWSEVAVVLATSHHPLGLSAEHVHEVPPLAEEPARELLADHLRRRGGRLSKTETRAVLAACGGLPLALQLVAPVVMTAGVGVLEDPAWQEATRGPVDADPHHRSLGAAIERAWAALGPEARDLLGCLTVFEGEVGLDGVRAVGGTLEPLLELRAHSLVHGREVLRLLPPIRAFAAARTGADLADARQRLARWLEEEASEDFVSLPLARRHLGDARRALRRTPRPRRLAWFIFLGATETGITPDILEALAAARHGADGEWITACLARAHFARDHESEEVQRLASGLTDPATVAWIRGLLERRVDAEDYAAVREHPDLAWIEQEVVLADLAGRDPDAERGAVVLRSLWEQSVDRPVVRSQLRTVLALAELRLGRLAAAHRLLREGPPLEGRRRVLVGVVSMCTGGPGEAIEPFRVAADELAVLGDATASDRARLYEALACWACGLPFDLPRQEDTSPRFVSIRRFLEDPAADPERLPYPRARALVAAWQRGELREAEQESWAMRLLSSALLART